MGSNSSLLLHSLIEDILDLSKLEAGTFSTTISRFSVVDVIKEVTEIFEPQWIQKKLELNINIEDELNVIEIDSDKGRVRQVLLNLMSNAFKFTFRGSISISAKLWDNNSSVEFWVEDTGIGIKEENISKLFNLFSMVDNNKEINPHGWGIGLTVSKRYIEKLGGTIWVESEFERYTKVIFTIPFPKSNPANHQEDIEFDFSKEEFCFSRNISTEHNVQKERIYRNFDFIPSIKNIDQ